ncbi:MGMT family protein [Candidatus Saccharibacteria bacterium]|nr:MGMT family protein [Candidatus Saccharibacteria bacterium]
MTEFQQAVLSVTRVIPSGKVVSYGQVAAYVGSPGAARQVGWVLRSLEGVDDFPWWRVVNNTGRITIKGNRLNTREIQRELLLSEGVEVGEDMTLDIEHYRYYAKPDQLRGFELKPEHIEQLMSRYQPN